MSGSVGIVYAHELLHQKTPAERWLGDLLLASVLYSHFRTEHLLVHHSWVSTPRDAVSARYNEGFHRFCPRPDRRPRSAWRGRDAVPGPRGPQPWDRRNPFWRLRRAAGAMLGLLAHGRGRLDRAGLFLFQALIAVWQLEPTNYVEQYGLSRKHLGGWAL